MSNEKSTKWILPEPTHIGIVCIDIEKMMKELMALWGIQSFKRIVPDYFNKRYRGQPEDFKMELAFARTGNMVYELIHVLQGKTIYNEFLRAHGEGVHHLGYEIQDLDGWVKAYAIMGIEPVMSGERIGLKFAYMDTPGVTIELVEREPEGRVV